jgi:hypothetical protein
MLNLFSNLPQIEISWGEFFDRLTILEIKLIKIIGSEKRIKVEAALRSLTKSGKPLDEFPEAVQILVKKLMDVNLSLWDIEDSKRESERRQDFGPDFISLARSVYIKNDLRAYYKREIDLLLDSKLSEVKSHDPYGNPPAG